MKKAIKIGFAAIGLLTGTFVLLLYSGIIWRSPKFYPVKTEKDFSVPIMDMAAYDTLGNHPRPYIYQISKGAGAVYVLGIEHTKDPNDAQIKKMEMLWNSFQPDIAFVEGRLGFLFNGLQDPVTQHGEGGKTFSLAQSNGIPCFSWESQKNDEVKILLQKYNPQQVALFYSLRPYFSDFRFGKPQNPEQKLEEYIGSRTDVDGIRNQIRLVAQVDSIWKKDFPGLKDWRDTSDQYGWPKGYLSEIFSLTNQIRDIHMCSAIIEQVNKGQKVFISMGSSHAFRIEKTLRHELQ
ncbi:hypothetical protein [Flavobacterium sp.]|uniref:hypothetical protein n=1 Tax=Flavobacterium sp. TaxID=239 RepID=UPI0039E4C0C3